MAAQAAGIEPAEGAVMPVLREHLTGEAVLTEPDALLDDARGLQVVEAVRLLHRAEIVSGPVESQIQLSGADLVLPEE